MQSPRRDRMEAGEERRGHDPQRKAGIPGEEGRTLRHKDGCCLERGEVKGVIVQQSEKEKANGVSFVFKDP